MHIQWKSWLRLSGAAGAAFIVGLAPGAAAVANTDTVLPNAVNMLDCNGHSPVYAAAKLNAGALCTDPIGIYDGEATRFSDNGHYVGHDEPSIKFISGAPGSGNSMTYFTRLARDPAAAPSPTSPTVSDYAELSPAPWFGLPICDPKSYPQNPCTPDSDANSGSISNPSAAGSAFLELQFYPPGFQPFVDAVSCDATRYCAAVNIDSLECTFGFATCNNNCIEPVNFAFLQLDGVPAGPPSPQLADRKTFTANAKTLLMNQGDVLTVTITDTPDGLLTRVVDNSTGQTGFMVASAANGFMNTNIADCSGTPFTFHPEYDTAKQENQVPWTALEAGVLMEQEIGHFEPCSSVSNAFPVNRSYPDGQTFTDSKVFQTCNGGFEGSGAVGEGPCSLTTGLCTNAKTQTGSSCPTNDFSSGVLCEFSDAYCMPAGPRPIIGDSVTQIVTWPLAGCQQNVFQNGDLDFDGSSYALAWPDGSRNHPTSFAYIGPFDRSNNPYPSIQFETDLAASEIQCNVTTGAGCSAPPSGATFYPFWTMRNGSLPHIPNHSTACMWNFGNTIPLVTTQDFGGAAQYGTPDLARFAGTLVSRVLPNPQFSSACKSS
jgi:hypothetical protein